MNEAQVRNVEFSRDALVVTLSNGDRLSAPLAWYPRLYNATAAQRNNWKITGGGYGIHWPDIDEDLSTEGLLRGSPVSRTARGRRQ